METRYTVRQAVEMTGIKSYVLRYWEEELNLCIQRNELGHRYYTGYDIQLFLNIKELKNRGLQLRAIRELIPQIAQIPPGNSKSDIRLLEEVENTEYTTNKEKTDGAEGSELLREEKSLTEKEKNHNAKILEFQAIMERLIQQELNSQNEDEEKCRSLDLAIRRQQMARREAAAAMADKKSSRKHRNN